MKLLRFGTDGVEKTGLLNDDEITELNSSMVEALNASDILEFKTENFYSLGDVDVLPPLSPSKVVCVGLNYRDHAKELDMKLPEEPVIFIKPSTAVTGHLDKVLYPPCSTQVDYEAELGIVIKKECHNVNKEDASDFIGGYTILNDVTARDKQHKDVQWTRAKSFDTFAPIGPCIETELDPMDQHISLRLNSDVKQDSNTKNMIFNVYELVEFISHVMTLKPGDVIGTGTAPGVGPMQIGDTVEAEVEGIGVLKNFIKSI